MTQEWTVHKVDEVLDLIEELTKKVKGIADHVREMQKTLDSITELQNEYNNPCLTTEWISVYDRVPDSGELVIMYINTPRYQGNCVTIGYYWVNMDTDRGCWQPAGWRDGEEDIVSYWMPIPDPPVED